MSTAHSAARKKSNAVSPGEPAKLKGFPIPIPLPGPPLIGPPQGAPQPLQAVQQAGQFAIATSNDNFVTAVAGGGKTTDVLHTDAVNPRAWEKFSLWFVPSTNEYGIQTANGEFLSATNGGDLNVLFPFGGQEVDTIESTSEHIIDYQRFRISNLPSAVSGSYSPYLFGIQSVRGFYLIAVAGGGQTSPPVLYTNGTTAAAKNPEQQFKLLKSGDAGSGYAYGLMVFGGPENVTGEGGPLPIGAWLDALFGGGQNGDALTIGPEVAGNEYELTWTLIRQSDGTYAFQTASGGYLTANGGGVLGSFRTDAMQVGNWQKFTLSPNNDCTYYVQAYNGYYLGASRYQKGDGTYVVAPTTTWDVTQAIKWRLWVFALAPNT